MEDRESGFGGFGVTLLIHGLLCYLIILVNSRSGKVHQLSILKGLQIIITGSESSLLNRFVLVPSQAHTSIVRVEFVVEKVHLQR